MSTISASTTTTTAYKVTADTTGTLVLQTGSTPTTAVTIDTSQNVLVGMSSYGVTNAGVSLSPTASSSFYVAGGTAVTIGRGTSDGTAVQFNRSGTNVGAVAVATTGLTMTGVNGITFTATQSASSDANTLDDYEEGYWTPTIQGSGGNPTVTYGYQTGTYVKIGRLVYVSGRLTVSTKSGGSGDFSIGGLPFSAATSQYAFGAGMVAYRDSWVSNPPDHFRIYTGTSIEAYYYTSTGELPVQVSTVQNGTQLIFNAMYQISA